MPGSPRNQEKEATIESQLALVDAYAQAHGYTIAEPHRFMDEAVSRCRLARPGLDRLRDAAKAQAFTVVLCLEPARLARNLGVQQVVLEELKRWGIAVIFVDQPEMAQDAHSQFWLQLRGAVAEYERTLISDRMRHGRLHRLRQGQTVPTQAPYGYAYVAASRERTSQWILVEKEAEIVRQLFVWYATGDKSLGDLARLLNAQAILSPEQGAWQAPTLGRLLRQPAYKGSAYYNRQQSDPTAIGLPRQTGRGHVSHPRYQERPADEWIACRVLPLVTAALWTQVQEQFTMHQRFSQRNSQRTYLLRSLLVCQICGHTLDELTLRSNPLAEERRFLEARLAKAPQPRPLQLSLPVFMQRIQRALDASDFATRQD